jgi:hypothetical protein
MTDEEMTRAFGKGLLVVIVGFATLFVVTGAVLTMLLH